MSAMYRRFLYAVSFAVLSAVGLVTFGVPLLAAPQTQAATAEQPPLTFRVEANFVEVDAFVTDAMGNPVTGLSAGDFQLLEDGKAQKISAFSKVDIPITRAERPLFSPSAIEPD